MSDLDQIKNKFRFFTFYKWAAIACFFLSIIFLFFGITQSISGGSAIDSLKSDFSNLSKDKPTSVILQEAENIGVEYTARTGRRSTITYYYFVIKTHDKKLILETKDKDDIKKGATINIKNAISATTAENQKNIKTLAVKNNANENTKISEQELLDIKFVKHYTDGDKFASDYWGWIVFAIFLVCTIVFGIRYLWDKRNYTIAIEDIKQASFSAQNTNQTTSTNHPQPEDNIQNQVFSNTNYTSTNNQSSYQSSPVSTPVDSSNYQYNQTKSNKTVYILLAVFLGIFGVHHFYNHKIIFGFLHLIWLFCLIISLFAIEQLAIIFLLSFILLPITFVASLIQALVKGLSKE
jgi:TM2 domain-containing membrane protein YozV